MTQTFLAPDARIIILCYLKIEGIMQRTRTIKPESLKLKILGRMRLLII